MVPASKTPSNDTHSVTINFLISNNFIFYKIQNSQGIKIVWNRQNRGYRSGEIRRAYVKIFFRSEVGEFLKNPDKMALIHETIIISDIAQFSELFLVELLKGRMKP